jgi:DNA invertase Pin-like site-specific DNA recombinase
LTAAAVDKFVPEDGVSGSKEVTDRPAFKATLAEMEEGDKFIVTG